MRFSHFKPVKPAAVVAAVAYTALTFTVAVDPAPLRAEPGAAFYQAELNAPASKERAIASGLLWTCTDTTCTAQKGTSRPVIVCKRLAKEVGPIHAFRANGELLDGGSLARCNEL